jgi:hypothetical protein
MAIDEIKSTLGIRSFISKADLTPGKVIQFTYDGEQKYALVLNPEWEGKLHALSIKDINLSKLIEIRKLIGSETDGQVLYSKFRNSNLVADRPYRTYLLSKVSTLREVFVKEEILKKAEVEVTENMYGE